MGFAPESKRITAPISKARMIERSGTLILRQKRPKIPLTMPEESSETFSVVIIFSGYWPIS
jgi:hypothetical protein